MKRSRIVFWQPTPSPHQSSFMRSLANLLPNNKIVGVFENPLPQARMNLGWCTPDFGRIQTVVAPDKEQMLQLAHETPGTSIHVLSGLRSPMIKCVFGEIAPSLSLVGVISEARDCRGMAGRMRRWHSLLFEKGYRDRVDFVLAVGNLGVQWFENCRYNSDRIFDWAYFVEKADPPEPAATRASNKVEIAYIGQLVPRKGVDILLRAMAQIERTNWSLKVVGRGASAQHLKELSVKLGIRKHVTFIEAVPNHRTREILSCLDVFVLPSRFDGWGAVVNESLMAGTPVVCTDRCGASILVESSGFGAVTMAQSTESMAYSLRRMIDRGPLDSRSRKTIRDWTDCIRGERAAEFFLEILEYCENGGARPQTPWLSNTRPAEFANHFPAGDSRKHQSIDCSNGAPIHEDLSDYPRYR